MYELTSDDIARSRPVEKQARNFAPGLPSREDLGDPAELSPGTIVPWVVQEHDALRSGKHRDIRLGKGKMMSWATRKQLPRPGEKVTVFQQPLHEESYKNFQGVIPLGYGAGIVRRSDLGEAVILEATPEKIKFAVGHKKKPQEFTLVRLSKGDGKKPAWFMFNTTPHEPVRHEKVHYSVVSADQIDRLFDPKYVMSEKIDGAASFLQLMKDKVNVLSYRTDTEGNPIVHTHRMGVAGKRFKIPRELQTKVLRGEIWGEREGRAIPAAELGGLLNASLVKSLREQQKRNVRLRMALFGVQDGNVPFEEKRKIIQEALKVLPAGVFHEPAYAYTPEEKRKMWEDIKAGRNPVTEEGVVGFPVVGGKPAKAKLYDERDVFIRDIFPGEGRLIGRAAGGLKYSLTPKGPVAGEVGTGFSEEERGRMWREPGEYIGRVARIRTQGQFPSGAYRAPAFLALHEDYPLKTAAYRLGELAAGGIVISNNDITGRHNRSALPGGSVVDTQRGSKAVGLNRKADSHFQYYRMGGGEGAGRFASLARLVNGQSSAKLVGGLLSALKKSSQYEKLIPVSTVIIVSPDGDERGRVSAEVANTRATRERGLSKRASLPLGTGMLFDTGGPFWMKDVGFPLDIIFMNKTGSVLDTQTMPVGPGTYSCRNGNASMALEVPTGWCDRCGVKPGDQIICHG